MRHRAIELLYDSEATLRLVDQELDALREFTAGVDAEGSAPRPEEDHASSLAPVPTSPQRATAEAVNVLGSLRQCRSQLEVALVERLQATQVTLREVTAATGVAATNILDGLDRARGLVDELDAEAAAAGQRSARTDDLRQRLRDELFMIAGCLQFQDVTNQQLSYASSVLVDLEARLGDAACLLDARRQGSPEPPPPPEDASFSPTAACGDAGRRQRTTDPVFTGPPARTTTG